MKSNSEVSPGLQLQGVRLPPPSSTSPTDPKMASPKPKPQSWIRMLTVKTGADKLRKEASASAGRLNTDFYSSPVPPPSLPAQTDSAIEHTFDSRSIRSIETLATFITHSTGQESQIGATWKHELITNMNSGFGRGGLRGAGYKGVREGRELMDGMPRIRGVGRTGKAPAPVPAGMLDALGVFNEDDFIRGRGCNTPVLGYLLCMAIFIFVLAASVVLEYFSEQLSSVLYFNGVKSSSLIKKETLPKLQEERASKDASGSQTLMDSKNHKDVDDTAKKEKERFQTGIVQCRESMIREIEQWQNVTRLG